MADINMDNAQKRVNIPSEKVKVNQQHGRLRVMFDEFDFLSTSSLPTGDNFLVISNDIGHILLKKVEQSQIAFFGELSFTGFALNLWRLRPSLRERHGIV